MWLNEIFRLAFHNIKTNYGTWLLIAIITFIVGGLPTLIAQPDVLEFYKNVNYDLSSPSSFPSLPVTDNMSILEILGLIISILITPGILAISLMGARGKNGKLDQIIKKAPLALKLFGFSIVYIIAVIAGIVALIIPGIYLLLRYSMTPLILVDQEGIGVFDAMKKSSDIMKGNYWKALFNFLILGIVILAVYLVLFVISLPLLIISSNLPILVLIISQVLFIISNSITYPMGNIGYGVVYTKILGGNSSENTPVNK